MGVKVRETLADQLCGIAAAPLARHDGHHSSELAPGAPRPTARCRTSRRTSSSWLTNLDVNFVGPLVALALSRTGGAAALRGATC